MHPRGKAERHHGRSQEHKAHNDRVGSEPVIDPLQVGQQEDRANAFVVQHDGLEQHQAIALEPVAVGGGLRGDVLCRSRADVFGKRTALARVKGRADDVRFDLQCREDLRRSVLVAEGQGGGGVLAKHISQERQLSHQRLAKRDQFLHKQGGAGQQHHKNACQQNDQHQFPLDR